MLFVFVGGFHTLSLSGPIGRFGLLVVYAGGIFALYGLIQERWSEEESHRT